MQRRKNYGTEGKNGVTEKKMMQWRKRHGEIMMQRRKNYATEKFFETEGKNDVTEKKMMQWRKKMVQRRKEVKMKYFCFHFSPLWRIQYPFSWHSSRSY